MRYAESERMHPVPPERSTDPDARQAKDDEQRDSEVDDKQSARKHVRPLLSYNQGWRYSTPYLA